MFQEKRNIFKNIFNLSNWNRIKVESLNINIWEHWRFSKINYSKNIARLPTTKSQDCKVEKSWLQNCQVAISQLLKVASLQNSYRFLKLWRQEGADTGMQDGIKQGWSFTFMRKKQVFKTGQFTHQLWLGSGTHATLARL